MPDAEPAPRIAHQPPLDGLRGIAVLAVLFFHNGRVEPLNLSMNGGYLGVDLFLVLSGYLITALLLAEHEASGRIGLVAFWGRRARRLLPALFLTLLLVAAYCALVASTSELEHIRDDTFATLLYVQNWHLAFRELSFGSPLSHTWSLSVEEQWYVIWPLLFAGLVAAFRRRPHSAGIVVGALACSFTAWTWFMYDSGASRGRMFYGTDTRIAPMLVGATLAFILERRRRVPRREGSAKAGSERLQKWLEAAGVAGAAWIAWALLTSRPNNPFMYRGGYFLFAVAAACLIAASVDSRSQILRPVLSVRALTAIGIVSYGVYLYHLPVFFWMTPERVPLDGFVLIVARFAITAALAIASFFLVERRFRHGRLKPAVSWVLVPAAAAIAIGAIVVTTNTEPDVVIAEPSSVASPASVIALRRIGESAPPGTTKVLVVGDGSAFGLGAAVRNQYRGDGVLGSTFADLHCGLAEGTPIVFGSPAKGLPTCEAWPDQYPTVVEAYRPDVVALMVGAREPFSRIVDGATLRFGTEEMDDRLRAELDRARAGLTGTGAHLMLLTVPCPSDPDASAVPTEQRSVTRIARINRVLREYAADHAPDVSVADLGETLCGPENEGNRTDNLHFTPIGAERTWAWLGDQARGRG